MTYYVNAFTIYQSLLQTAVKVLPIIYQNRTKIPEKSSKFGVRL